MQVTPINRTYPARNAAGSVTISDSSVVVAVANDGPGLVQAALCRRGEGGDYSVVAVLNLGAGPAPAQEKIVPNEGTADFSVVILNGTTSEVRAYISGYAIAAPMPAGGATAAKQDTGNASLASIDAKLTDPLSVSAAALPLPSGAATEAKQDAGNASLATLATNSPALVSGRIPVDAIGTVAVSNLPATQPVSGTVSVDNFPASQAVVGPLTDAQLRATPVPVSGTVTATGPLTDTELRAAAVPVSAASLPLPAGAATAAKQPTIGTAGSPSADVLSVQGVAGGLAVRTTSPAATNSTTGNVGVYNTPSTVILAANSAAKLRKIYNGSASIVFCYYGTSAFVMSANYATFQILPGQTWEMPASNGQCEWTGVITGNCASSVAVFPTEAT